MKPKKIFPFVDDMEYHWSYCSLGGEVRVKISCGDDIAHLGELDRKMWTVLSCPVKGLRLDAKTLDFLDSDKDGRIMVNEVVEAGKWLVSALKDSDDALKGADEIDISGFNAENQAGSALRSSAKFVLERLGEERSVIRLDDCADMQKIFAGTPFNGDGMISLLSTEDAADKQAIEACMKVMGSSTDISGEEAVDAEKIESFYKQLGDWKEWKDKAQSDASILPFGPDTGKALAACQALEAKIEDYFIRCALVSFDEDACAAMDVSVESLAKAGSSLLNSSTEEIVAAPLARPCKDSILSFDAVNPAWKTAFEELRSLVLDKELGNAGSMTEKQWKDMVAKFSAFKAWQAEMPAGTVAGLGDEAVEELLKQDRKDALLELIAKDLEKQTETTSVKDLDKFLHLYRDFYVFLSNYVIFTDFYSPSKKAVFDAGELFIDQRCCRLCVEVSDMEANIEGAGYSEMFLIYCSCVSRNTNQKKDIVAILTAGSVKNIRKGTNAVYRDRDGHDWDAVVTKVIDNPISVRQAFWTPYRKFAAFVSEKINKSASDREAETFKKFQENTDVVADNAHNQVAAGDVQKQEVSKAASAFDIAKFAGIFAAIGMALGYIGAFLTSVASGARDVGFFGTLLVIMGILICISGPSCFLAWTKLRKRNLGPVLNANGWAINSDVKVNIIFGATLTSTAKYPKLNLEDPFVAKKTPAWKKTLIAIAIVAVLGGLMYFCGMFDFCTCHNPDISAVQSVK